MVNPAVLGYFNNLIRLYLLVGVCVCQWVLPARGQEAKAIKTVVIDAGHGGKDPGTVGRKTQEKYITLAVALKVGTLIRQNLPEVQVIYTRDRDIFIELHERAAIANRNQADLFISIHANANKVKTLRGAESYIMGLHRTSENLEIAKLENAAILMESDYTSHYEGFDPNSDESYIIFTLYQNSNLERSSQFAAGIQEEMSDRVGLTDRGVRQAGFLVLYKTTMPSVLVEVGYLSNTEEEDFLISDKGQEYISSAIYRAFRQYKDDAEGVTSPEKEKTAPVVPPSASPAKDPAPVNSGPGVVFKVQLAASPKEIKASDPRFKGLKDIRMYRHDGMYKYTYGETSDPDTADALLVKMKKQGFKDAFLVAFRNGKRIPLNEAKVILGKE
jgi:N-acetylmuramoyl-L-alanine amidase